MVTPGATSNTHYVVISPKLSLVARVSCIAHCEKMKNCITCSLCLSTQPGQTDIQTDKGSHGPVGFVSGKICTGHA